MTVVNIDTDKIKKDVIPLFDYCIKDLDDSINLLKETKLPIAFKYIQNIKHISNSLEKNHLVLKEQKETILKNISKFDTLNNSLLEEITNIDQIMIYKK